MVYAMINNMIGTRGVKIIFLMILIVGVVTPVQARQDGCDEYTIWKEERTGNFAVLYTPEAGGFAQGMIAQYGDDLEAMYAAFGQAFGESPQTPITIRVYPRAHEYYCLNPFPPTLAPGATHSHISSQEIALLGNELFADVFTWQVEVRNAFNYELAVLFVEQVSGGNAPPGLLAGMGYYAQAPDDVIPPMRTIFGFGSAPTMDWRAVWEAEDFSDAALGLQAHSITAYLIDVYGWSQYIAFLNKLETAGSYRQALRETYDMSLSELEDHWRVYFPAYLRGRWAVNVIHEFDLSVYEQLLDASAYTDARDGLREAAGVIEIFEGGEKLQYVNDLLRLAELGIEAGALAGQARQAIISGDYPAAASAAEQSLDKFARLGDASRLEEITAYKEIAEEIIVLRIELDELGQKDSLTDPTVPRRLEQIGGRLAELGDKEGVEMTQAALLAVGQNKRYLSWGLGGLGIVLVLGLLFRQVRSFSDKDKEPDLI